MGLLKFAKFSSIPTFLKRSELKTKQKEARDTFLPVGKFDWIMDNGELIVANQTAVNTTVTMYTVPTGKRFYLISAGLSCSTTAAVTNQRGRIDVGGTGFLFVELDGDGSFDTIALSNSTPLVFNEGQTIQVNSSAAGLRAIGFMAGYEIDQKFEMQKF